VKKVFNPEFLNRVDETLVFHRLTKTELLEIVDIEVDEVVNRVAEKGLVLNLTQEAKEFLADTGSNEEYGARPLRRSVQQHIEDALAELLLRGDLPEGTTIDVRPSDLENKLVFETTDTLAAEGVTT